MTPAEAAAALEREVHQKQREMEQQMVARLPRAANALRNAELTVLSGNVSPSPPGSPPGRDTGILRATWTPIANGGGGSGVFGIKSGAHYAGYLEHGTRKMAARPFVDKIQAEALPEIIGIFSEIGG